MVEMMMRCHPLDKREGFVKAEKCMELRAATLASGRFGDRSATRVLYESHRPYSDSSGIISKTSTGAIFPFCVAGLNCHC